MTEITTIRDKIIVDNLDGEGEKLEFSPLVRTVIFGCEVKGKELYSNQICAGSGMYGCNSHLEGLNANGGNLGTTYAVASRATAKNNLYASKVVVGSHMIGGSLVEVNGVIRTDFGNNPLLEIQSDIYRTDQNEENLSPEDYLIVELFGIPNIRNITTSSQ